MSDDTWRGHHAKIHAAVQALRERGLLPPYLRPTERACVICLELTRQGYTDEQMPSIDAIRRYFQRVRKMRETRVA